MSYRLLKNVIEDNNYDKYSPKGNCFFQINNAFIVKTVIFKNTVDN